MARLTVAFGAALILIGVITYFATGQESVTALIPAFVGGPVLLAGLVSLRTEWRSYGLYAAAGLVCCCWRLVLSAAPSASSAATFHPQR